MTRHPILKSHQVFKEKLVGSPSSCHHLDKRKNTWYLISTQIPKRFTKRFHCLPRFQKHRHPATAAATPLLLIKLTKANEPTTEITMMGKQ
jgi:hypothetical protein